MFVPSVGLVLIVRVAGRVPRPLRRGVPHGCDSSGTRPRNLATIRSAVTNALRRAGHAFIPTGRRAHTNRRAHSPWLPLWQTRTDREHAEALGQGRDARGDRPPGPSIEAPDDRSVLAACRPGPRRELVPRGISRRRPAAPGRRPRDSKDTVMRIRTATFPRSRRWRTSTPTICPSWTGAGSEAVLTVEPGLLVEFSNEAKDRIWSALDPL